MNDAVSIISNVGFPIFVALYMLYFVRSTLEKINDTLRQIKTQNEFLIRLLSRGSDPK